MKKVFLSLTLLKIIIAAIVISATSCKKDESPYPSQSGESSINDAQDFEQGEQISSDLDNMSDMAYVTNDVNLRNGFPDYSYSILSCATVTKDTVNKIITIDFGTGCIGSDGRLRSGQVIIHYNGHYFDPGFTRIISFNNYYVDSCHIEGSRSITNNGLNVNGNLNWTIIADSIKITKPNGYYHIWNSSRNREMIAGSSTPHLVSDDVYLITGSGTGSNSNGQSVTIAITTALRMELSCRWIVSGTVNTTPSGKPTRTLDYGTGTCDRFATVTVNGIVKNIILH
jgi:hypothetical protein